MLKHSPKKWRAAWGTAVIAGVVLFSGQLGAVDDRLRLEGVFYLEDYLEKPLELKALRLSAISSGRDGSGPLGTLREGQLARLIGMAKDQYLVSARTLDSGGGKTEGWVPISALEPIPNEVLKELDKKSREAKELKDAIDRKEIAIGMPQDAVLKMMGQPKAKSEVQDASGVVEQWTYPTYKMVPVSISSHDQFGNLVYLSTYRKIPVGNKIITFQDKKIIRVETRQDDTTFLKSGSLVVPPVILN